MKLDSSVKAVVFDIDGTMMRTHVDYTKLNRVAFDYLRSIGVPADDLDKTDNTISIKKGYKWLRAHGRESEIAGSEKEMGDRMTAVEMEHSAEAEPIPGMVACINTLKEHGYKVGALTRGGRSYAELILQKGDLLGLMDAVVARDDYPYLEGKPNRQSVLHIAKKLDVASGDVVFVGDSVSDYNTAVAAKCQFIGVTTGSLTYLDQWYDAVKTIDVKLLRTAADVKSLI